MDRILTTRATALASAIDVLAQLKVPEHLQDTALNFLLKQDGLSAPATGSQPRLAPLSGSAQPEEELRGFIARVKPKGAVSEIPTLLYWALRNENKESADEKTVVELFRRSGLRPPKNVMQSLHDLSSKRYMRLEPASEKGFFKLSRVGEDYVLHEVINLANNAA
jgi:hypothetical protein